MMIFNTKVLLDAYPHAVTEIPDTTQPYVMFAGTPYAHLIIPVNRSETAGRRPARECLSACRRRTPVFPLLALRRTNSTSKVRF